MRIAFNALDFHFAQLFCLQPDRREEKLLCSKSLKVLPSSFTTILYNQRFFQTLNAFMVYWVRGEKKMMIMPSTILVMCKEKNKLEITNYRYPLVGKYNYS